MIIIITYNNNICHSFPVEFKKPGLRVKSRGFLKQKKSCASLGKKNRSEFARFARFHLLTTILQLIVCTNNSVAFWEIFGL